MRRTTFVFAIALLASAIAANTRVAASEPRQDLEAKQHAEHDNAPSSTLVRRVREATEAFRQAIPDDYQQFLGCVSGPEKGAMGVHFVNFGLLDDKVDAAHPEALIYELKNGRARLVGVEFIVPAAAWDATHTDPPEPPALEGQVFHFNDSPNRFRLAPFYELHVWAWRDNPSGTFADWNSRVSCDGQ